MKRQTVNVSGKEHVSFKLQGLNTRLSNFFKLYRRELCVEDDLGGFRLYQIDVLCVRLTGFC